MEGIEAGAGAATEPLTAAGNGAASEAAGLSFVEKLKRDRDKRMEEAEEVKFSLPSWADDLAAGFRVIPRPELEQFQEQAQRKARRKEGSPADFDMDFLAKSCSGVFARDPDSGRLVALERDGRPAKFDKLLADILELSDEQARNSHTIISYLFGGNGVAIGAMALRVARWMSDTSAEVEGALVGE